MEPRMRSLDGDTGNFHGVRRNSPKAKLAVADRTFGGENEASEKLADPIRVYSEKELTKEMDKIANMLASEQDWSIRMSAMQRLEGLVHGGASEYPSFPSLIKQLVGPLSVQLSDRRSSIVKQACQLLNVLSKELLADFESCAESFIPVLFKLVVITVLVIAESADTCIKTMLRNCRVMRVLPRIIDCAKNDRSPVLRARCCEYALLILEQWANSSEIQRSVDIYEDLIKCCVGDAMSEVRSTARACYRVFAKYWPDRGHRLYVGFDAVIQRLINEEEGGGILLKRHSSPLVRERGPANQVRQSASYQASAGIIMQSTGGQQQQMSSFSAMPVIAMDKNSSLVSVSSSASSGSLLHAFRKPTDRGPERTLESVLQASQQKVNAIEAMLKGTDISNKGNISAATTSTTTTSSTSASLNTKDQGGSYRKLHATVATGRSGVDPPSARDPPHPASASILSQASHYSSTSSYLKGSLIGMEDATSSLSGSLNDMHPSAVSSFSAKRVPVAVTGLDRVSQSSSNDEMHDYRPYQRVLKSDQSDAYKNHANNSIPSFQRPLLRAAVSARSSGSSWSSLEETPLPAGESFNQTDGLTSLHDALTEGLSANADWSTRVAAFNYLRKLLQQQQQGARGGIQEVTQCFEKTMKLFSVHLDDPHHKVALAALSTLAEIIPAFRKPFDAYLERILPHVFARLVDPKEAIRHMSTSALDVIANTYSIESLLPALLRSLDEQRSPKAKVAVIEFSINIFAKLAVNGEGGSGGNLLKLWLAKLTPLVHCKNPKLKETAVSCIVSVYSHLDSTAVLNFILGLSIEEQTSLRRALKQYTPRIEVDLINFLQSRNQKAKSSKIIHDQVLTLNAEDDYASTGRFNSFIPKNQYGGGYTTLGSVNSDGGRKQSSHQPDSAEYSTASSGVATKEEKHRSYFPNYEVSGQVEDSLQFSKGKDEPVKSLLEGNLRSANSWSDHNLRANQSSPEQRNGVGSNMAVQIDSRQALDNEQHGHTIGDREFNEIQMDFERSTFQPSPTQNMHTIDSLIPDLLNQLCSNDDKITVKKQEAFDKIIELSRKNDTPLWSKFHNQILAGLLELVDKSDPSIRENALSTILELLTNQKQFLEDTVEILLEKFLHCSKDLIATVSDVADRCLNMILAQYDAHRCLTVIVPLLASEDEKTLVCCISSLTKLVSRFPSEELMAQLPSFLPALFDAFGNQSADVRKTVVFCLVDIYIVLGKAFLPYLGSLSSTQLRLVTIYANRISQARSGTPLDVGPS